jgi:hypothetical protein
MESFTKSVTGVLGGALRAVKTFPVTVGCAAAFTVIVLIRIQYSWSSEALYDYIFTCAQWSLALGALLGMTAVAVSQVYMRAKSSNAALNVFAAASVVVTFTALYFGGETQVNGISQISALRVSAAMFVSLVAFVVIIGHPSDETDFTSSLFMVHKSFFIALLYGLVALGGASGVAGAVQGLIYSGMSYKVYQYIITLSALLAFLLFVGYFPILREGTDPERREKAQHEPRFIEILLSYILAPIMLALTVVLLIWAVMNLFGVTKSSFEQLSAITAAYTLGGLWLHAITSRDDNASVKLYRAVYPVAALVILAFEAWAVATQLLKHGLQTTEYLFILIWLLAVAGNIIILVKRGIKRPSAHSSIAVVACALAIIAVLPFIGSIDLPIAAQTTRLKALLQSQNMLEGDVIIPASTEPDKETRAAITDAVQFLTYSGGKLPAWLDKDYSQSDVFSKKFGFDMLWLNNDGVPTDNGQSHEVYLSPSESAVDISGYSFAIGLSDTAKSQSGITFTATHGTYTVNWNTDDVSGIPTLLIKLDGKTVLEQNFDSYVSGLLDKYPLGTGSVEVPRTEMVVTIKGENLTALITFSSISITEYSNGSRNVWIMPDQLFILEQ